MGHTVLVWKLLLWWGLKSCCCCSFLLTSPSTFCAVSPAPNCGHRDFVAPKRWVADSSTDGQERSRRRRRWSRSAQLNTLKSSSTSWGPKFGDSWSPPLCLNSLQPASRRQQLIARPLSLLHQKWPIFPLRLLWTMAFTRQLRQVR